MRVAAVRAGRAACRSKRSWLASHPAEHPTHAEFSPVSFGHVHSCKRYCLRKPSVARCSTSGTLFPRRSSMSDAVIVEAATVPEGGGVSHSPFSWRAAIDDKIAAMADSFIDIVQVSVVW